MQKNLIIGIDSSTTATKAIAWRKDGSIAGEGRSAIGLSRPANNWYEQDPEDWWRSTVDAIRQVLQQVPRESVAAVAISNQRETFVPLDERGEPVRPAILWLDQRCAEEVEWLSERVPRIHEITGKPPDMAPVAYRIAWMLRNEETLFRRTRMFADVHTYLVWKLAERFVTSWASADPMGMFDMQRKQWSPEILSALCLTADRLPELARPGSVIGEVSESASKICGLLPGTPIVAGGGDGQAAGLGVNTVTAERAYLNLGTALVSGTYSPEFRVGRAWRTMGSCTGEGCYLETSLRTGAFLMDWFAKELCGGGNDIFQSLEAEASQVPVGSDGVLALPYWGAVMTPYWDPKARGCFTGITASHRRAHLYRALLEGTALEQALVTRMIEEETSTEVREFVAIGGGASSDLWCQIMADATGRKVLRSSTLEASSLGAGICAAVGAGWFANAARAAAEMTGRIVREFAPGPENARKYKEVQAVYRELYPNLKEIFVALDGINAR
ncbi:MAG TPA: FGGY-family carbohydrate kinase [Terriglobales bacterium]|nr:FGGY-family carbohydrate kinase [Terriglobales bacterium]